MQKGPEDSHYFFTCNFVSSGKFFMVIELFQSSECKLDCIAWIQLQMLKNHNSRTFMISHKTLLDFSLQ